MTINVYEEVFEKQGNYTYDPDSSPRAFDYYRIIYSSSIGKRYDLENVHPMVYDKENRKYINRYLEGEINRLCAIKKGVLPENCCNNGEEVFSACARISGETDFNFKSDREKSKDKAGRLVELSGNDAVVKKRMYEHYSKMHHTAVNFSLMFVPGNLQLKKSRGHNEEWLDRPDTFVCLLDKYFHDENSEFITKNANGEMLKKYLDYYKDGGIEKYCKEIYLIEDKALIKRMKDFGAKPLEGKKDVEEYLELADWFWEEKAKVANRLMSVGKTYSDMH